MINNNNRGILTTNNLIEVLNEVNVSSFSDQFGPEEVIQVYDPDLNMYGLLVIDNTALGPGMGCIRISPDITPRNIFLSARAITCKCALVQIPFGGAKAGIKADPLTIDKIRYLKVFGKKIAPFIPWKYIASPDINTTPNEFAHFVETIGDRQGATGKPEKMGGIPNTIGTNGFGVGIALETAVKSLADSLNISADLEKTKVAIQGWSSIGLGLAKYLSLKNCRIIALKDKWNSIYNSDGLNIDDLKKYVNSNSEITSIKKHKEATILPPEAFLSIDCDILVLCDAKNYVDENNWDQINTKIIIEGIPNRISERAEQKLYKKGIWTIPDILATSGGIISSYVEHVQKDIPEAFTMIESKIKKSTGEVLDLSQSSGLMPRVVGKDIAKQRIIDAMENRI